MFNLSGVAQEIVEQLEAVAAIATVGWIEDEAQAERYQQTLPAVFVALDNLSPRDTSGKSVSSAVVWVLLIRTKGLEGPSGCLSLIDQLLDAMVGYKPTGMAKSLRMSEVKFYKAQGETVSYTVRLTGDVRGVRKNMPDGM